jgi:CubicO group peptidase (beta-lactamase class C family)
VDQRIVDFFPELAGDREPRKQTITIEDLLTMRSGLASTSGRQYGAWVQSGNWVRYALGRPLEDEPGTRVEYEREHAF